MGRLTEALGQRNRRTSVNNANRNSVNADIAKAVNELNKMLDYYIEGHEKMQWFYPPLAGEIFMNAEEDINVLAQYFINQASVIDQGRYDPVYSDIYIQKAIENGLFDESNLLLLRNNTIELLSLLKDLQPNLFFSNQKT